MTILFEVMTVAILVIALVLLIRERRRFTAFRIILMGIPFIAVARAAEAYIKLRGSPFAAMGIEGWVLSTISDLFDVIGILLLVVGFIQALHAQRDAADKIERLEVLLPLCAQCKKFRTEDGQWKPIEEYVTTRGDAGGVTHGYCPQCAEKLFKEMEDYRAS